MRGALRVLWLILGLASAIAPLPVTVPFVAGMLLAPPAALAATNPDEMLEDPALEARARALAKRLRCLVCQNQSIDDSDAELAHDLRRIVRERLVAGDSDQEVIDFLTARYGDFVLLRPPVEPATWGLWFGPAIVLLLAAVGVAVYVRRRAASTPMPAPLSDDERARVDALLEDEADPRPG